MNNTKAMEFHGVIKENEKEYDPYLPQIPGHPYKIFITERSGSGKTKGLFNVMDFKQMLIDFICMLKIQIKQNTNF